MSEIEDEARLFPEVEGLAAALAAGTPPEGPAQAVIEPPRQAGGHAVGDVRLLYARDVTIWPRLGLVRLADGRVPAHAHSASRLRDRPLPEAPGSAPRIPRAAIWLGKGACRNYGHFLFDGLPGLTWLDESGVGAAYPPLAPPLAAWQREILAMAGLPAPLIRREAAVNVGEAVILTSINHYLQRGDGLLFAAAARLGRPAAPPPPPGPGPFAGALYLSRRGVWSRVLLEEARLERAILQGGGRVIRPEGMSARAQAEAARGARTLAGPSGAALGNLIHLAPGARVVELRPSAVDEPWMAVSTLALGLRHEVVSGSAPLAAPPLAARVKTLPRRLYGRQAWAWSVDVAEVLARLAE
ncbi:DUF563 domain-containing protein [Pseudoroseicyclus sp. CXY001]|uniref:glycosyltransferase family 61 protein n=1 Tax=Pseudoroseicyclus sp. CXY001 TaxID=3242492 RepID=UPI0035716890